MVPRSLNPDSNPDSNPPLFFSNPNPDSCFLGLNPNPNPNPAQKPLNPDSNPNPDSDLHITDMKMRLALEIFQALVTVGVKTVMLKGPLIP